MRTFKSLACTALVACGCCFILTGCGTKDNGSTSGNNDNNAVEDVADKTGNAAEDIVDGVGNAAEDVADGVGNAVDDLVGNDGFDNYDDAHDYFLDTMESYHADAKFEIRDEDRNLTDYQEGSKGYRFQLYDTSKNADGDLFGEFYVDAVSGTIYQKDTAGNFVEYGNTMTTKATDGTNVKGSANTTDGASGNNSKTGAVNDTSTDGATTNTGNVSSVR